MRAYFSREWRGGMKWWHVHVVLVTIAVALIVGAVSYERGRSDQAKYDASYWQRTEQMSLNHERMQSPPLGAPVVQAVAPPTAATGGVFMKWVEPAFDQGQVGDCQCEAFDRQFSYLASVRDVRRMVFSCAFWYPILTQGIDKGSYFTQYPPMLAAIGGTLTDEYDWSQQPPREDGPIPTSAIYAIARRHVYHARTEVIAATQDAGLGAINWIEKRLSQHLMVNFDTYVYEGAGANSFFDVNQNDGIVDDPAGEPAIAGGHAVTLLRYFRDLCLDGPNGRQCGFMEGINSWGANNYGVNCQQPIVNGVPSLTPSGSGCFLVSYRYLETQGWGYYVLHLSSRVAPTVPKPPVWAQPGPSGDKGVPAPTGVIGHALSVVGANWVHGVVVSDEPGDFGRLINAAAHRNGINPVMLLATLRNECGYFTHSTRCDRWGSGADVSFGWCQVTVQTALGYGIGGGNPYTVRDYENDIPRCVNLGAKILGDYNRYEQSVGCDLPTTNLYVAWNAGPGQPCWFLLNPSYGSQAYLNFRNYLVWYRIALGQSATVNPYAKSFPVAAWGSWPYRAHGHLTWPAAHYRAWLGRYEGGRFTRRPKHMTYRFAHGTMACFYATSTCTLHHG